MARNCPTNNSVKSSSSGKPPGLSSFSLGIDLEETERLRDACLPEGSGLSLGMIDLGGDSDSDGLEYIDPPVIDRPPESESDNVQDLVESDSEFDDLPELMSESDPDIEDIPDDYESVSSDEQSDWPDESLSAIDEFVNMENQAAAEEGAPVLFVLSPPMQFAMYEGHIPHPSVRLAMIEFEAERRGDRRALGYAPAQALEYVLESSQPYPGDPFNVLQFRGPRFMAYQTSEMDITVHDLVFDTSDIVPVSVATNVQFEAAYWYALRRHE